MQDRPPEYRLAEEKNVAKSRGKRNYSGEKPRPKHSYTDVLGAVFFGVRE